jgi:hypothetical protein
MRYLYADSEPFPLLYPFLPTLDAFVRCAARALRALTLVRGVERQLAERRQHAVRGIELLDGFVVSVLDTVEAARARADGDGVTSYADELKTYIEHSAQSARVSRERDLEHQVNELDRQKSDQRAAMREAISEFLLVGHVIPLTSRYRARFVDGRYRLWATCSLPNGIEIAYRLMADKLPDWQHPRRIGSFIRDLELQVGMKKAWLSSSMTRELVRVDDYMLAAAVLDPTRAELHVRKRADSPADSFVLLLERGEGGITADIDRPAEAGEPARFHAGPEDLPKLEELWQRVAESCAVALDYKEGVESVTQEGHDVFEDERILTFVDLFITGFAPVVAEIARRSPSPRELSLKLEHSDGRREEIYLKKEQLAAHLSGLEKEMLDRFKRMDVLPKEN